MAVRTVRADVDADQTTIALSGLDATAGMVVQTGADAFTKRTLTGTANEVDVANGSGASGAPTISLPTALTFTGKTVTGGTFNSPTLVTPALGTPASGNLMNCKVTRDCATYAEMKALTADELSTGAVFAVTDRATAGAGGGGKFVWRSGDQSASVVFATKTVASVNTGTDILTVTGHSLSLGDVVIASAADAGLSINTLYYVSVATADTLSLHTSLSDAVAGTNKVNITSLSGALSLKLLIDPAQGVYVTRDGDDLDGSDGAFVRDYSRFLIPVECFNVFPSLSDQSTGMNAAHATAGRLRINRVLYQAQKYGIANTIWLGDGSTLKISSYNGVIAQGMGWEGAINALFDNTRYSTTWVWVGSAGGRCVDMRGPVRGCWLESIVIDGGETASFGLRLTGVSFGDFARISIWRCRERALETGVTQIADATLDAIGGGVSYNIRSTTDVTFRNVDIDAYTGVTGYGCVAIHMDGWDASNFDTCRVRFYDTSIIVNLNNSVSLGRAGVGIWMRFTDSCHFTGLWIQGLGTPASPTTASWLYLEGCQVGSANYPTNHTIAGRVQRGQHLRMTRDATSASPGGNIKIELGEVDGEYIPKWPETKNVLGFQPESVDSDTEINYVSEYGLQRIRDERRNQLLNSGFWRATRATSFSSPAANTYTLDGWVVDYDGTPVGLVISQQAFTLGQTDVAWEPRHHARIVVTSGSGMTSFAFSQRVEDVRRFSGRNCCLSVWAKVSSGTIALTAKVDQDFGTGGSPSSNVVTSCNTEDASQTVTTTWQRFRFRFSMPSVSGKTLGSGGNDHTDVIFSLPLNSGFTLDLAEPQFEYGLTDSPWDRHSKDLTAEEAWCARYLRSIPRTLNRIYNDFAVVSTANLLDSIVKFPSMRTTPALVVSGSASDYQIRDYAGNNGGNCDSSPTLVQVGAEAAILRFTLTAHGLSAGTLGRQESGSSGLLLLSAEL